MIARGSIPGQTCARWPVKQAEASSAASTRRRPAALSCSWRSRCLAATASPACPNAALRSRSAAPKPLSFSSCANWETTSARNDDLASSPVHPAGFRYGDAPRLCSLLQRRYGVQLWSSLLAQAGSMSL